MSLKDLLAQDADKIFLNTNEFAEDILYILDGEPSKTIKAIVNRSRVDPASESFGRNLTNQIEIIIANDATTGVSSINVGKDTVILPEFIGGENIDWRVVDILGQDEGVWHILLQK